MNKNTDNISENSQNSLSLSDSEELGKDFLQKKRKKKDKKNFSISKYESPKINQEKNNRKKIQKYIDISSKREKFPIMLLKSYRTKLIKAFNYQTNYIISSNILNYKKSSNTTTVNNPIYNTIDSIDEFRLPKTYHCSCKNICIPDTCACIQMHTQKFECNDSCTCYKGACTNRNIQYGINHKFSIRYTKNKGFGVFAEEEIEKGEFVCEYIGTIITKNEAEKKIHFNHINQRPNYILQLKEEYPNIIMSTYIDSEIYGNFARFINHSCDPNLDFEIIRVNSFIPHCAFFANKKISEGEEITFSYIGTNYEIKKDDFNEIKNNHEDEKENNKIENNIKNEKISFSYKKCYCGAKNCKGFIPN
jgi:SET domain-containing protein